MEITKQDKNIALVMSGGGAKGGFQVGALHYVKQYHPEIWDNIKIVAGVSVGALNATLLAMGDEGWTQLFNLWKTIRKKDIMEGDTQWYNMLWRLYKKRKSIYSNRPLAKLIGRIVDVNKIEKELSIGVVNLTDGEYHKIRKNSPNFKSLLVASASIPIVFPPVYIDKDCYVDGGVRNVSPLKDVLEHNPDRIIVINCSDPDLKRQGKTPKNILDIAQKTLDIMMNEIFRNDLNPILESPPVPITLIEPTIDLGETLDFDKAILDKRMQHGWDEAKEVLGA